jgi:hypothetical protein
MSHANALSFPSYDQGGLCDRLSIRAPKGFRDEIQRAARAAGVPASELTRRAIASRVSELLGRDASPRFEGGR